MVENDLIPPDPDELDEALGAADVWLNSLPALVAFGALESGSGLGSAIALSGGAAALLRFVVGSPVERRTREWAKKVVKVVIDLKDRRGIQPEQLRDDPVFTDAVLSISAAAVRTSQREKHEALRNALLNAALPGRPDPSIQQMFIAAVDRLTERHLQVLKLVQDSGTAAGRANSARPGSSSSLDEVLAHVYDPLIGPRDFLDVIYSDLLTLGFYRVGEPGTLTTADGPKRTTALGDQFLAFIADPFAMDH